MTYPDGSKYQGEWKDGKPHGKGTYTFKSGDSLRNGSTYQGDWENGFRNGYGTYTWSDGHKSEDDEWIFDTPSLPPHGLGGTYNIYRYGKPYKFRTGCIKEDYPNPYL